MASFLIRQNPMYAEPGYSSKIIKYLETGEIVSLERPIAVGDEFAQVRVSNKIGFVRADWLEDYHDPFLPSGQLRIPKDNEILDAVYAGRAPQYIYLGEIGVRRIHYNLCGEFCCAALAGMDVLPACFAWRRAYTPAQRILANILGSGVADLWAMLSALGIKAVNLRFDAKYPPSPARLAALNTLIIGVGIKTNGVVDRAGKIRHWAVMLNFLALGNSGFAQVYNPFRNRTEIVEYRDLLESGGGLTALEVLR